MMDMISFQPKPKLTIFRHLMGRHNPEWTALHTKKETLIAFSVVRLVSSCTPRTQPQYIFNANVNTFSRSIGADDYEDVFK